MELSPSALGASLRVVLQVVTMHKRPMLEMYTRLVNRRVPMQGSTRQDMHLAFYLVNIGSIRAENIRFELRKDFEYRGGHSKIGQKPLFHDDRISFMPPGQTLHLFVFDLPHDLQVFGADGKPSGFRAEGFSFVVRYNGSGGFLNFLSQQWARLRKRDYQYEAEFQFDPRNYEGDLPPLEYS